MDLIKKIISIKITFMVTCITVGRIQYFSEFVKHAESNFLFHRKTPKAAIIPVSRLVIKEIF